MHNQVNHPSTYFLIRRDALGHVFDGKRHPADKAIIAGSYIYPPVAGHRYIFQRVSPIPSIATALDGETYLARREPILESRVVELPLVGNRRRKPRRRENRREHVHSLPRRFVEDRIVAEVALVPLQGFCLQVIFTLHPFHRVIHARVLKCERQRRNRVREVEDVEKKQDGSKALEELYARSTICLGRENREYTDERSYEKDAKRLTHKKHRRPDSSRDNRQKEDEEREQDRKEDARLKYEASVEFSEAFITNKKYGKNTNKNPACRVGRALAVEDDKGAEEAAETELHRDGDKRQDGEERLAPHAT